MTSSPAKSRLITERVGCVSLLMMIINSERDPFHLMHAMRTGRSKQGLLNDITWYAKSVKDPATLRMLGTIYRDVKGF